MSVKRRISCWEEKEGGGISNPETWKYVAFLVWLGIYSTWLCVWLWTLDVGFERRRAAAPVTYANRNWRTDGRRTKKGGSQPPFVFPYVYTQSSWKGGNKSIEAEGAITAALPSPFVKRGAFWDLLWLPTPTYKRFDGRTVEGMGFIWEILIFCSPPPIAGKAGSPEVRFQVQSRKRKTSWGRGRTAKREGGFEWRAWRN